MKALSVGASLVWQIAAAEAAGAKHQEIAKEHLLILDVQKFLVAFFLAE
jgi:hypothetical protein